MKAKFKAITVILLVFLFAATTVMFSAASPSQENNGRVHYEVSVQPGQVTVPGDGGKVTVKVTVRISTAENDFTASGFKLYYGEQEVADLGSAGITSSDAEPLKAEFDVELSAQDIGIKQTVYAQYSFAYGQDSDMTQTVRHEAGRFTVTEKPADAYLLVLEPDKAIVENGGTVNFNGTFTNNSGTTTPGNAYIHFETGGSVHISDVSIGGIENGGTKSISFSCGSIQSDFTVTPTVVCEGEHPFQPITIQVKRTEAQFYLVARPQASGKYNETITIVYTVVNSGNVQLSELSILNENNDRIMTNASTLAPGKTLTGSVTMRITGDKTVRYSLTALDSFGRDYQVNSNGVDITLEANADDIALGIVAQTQSTTIQTPGENVTFEVTVSNKSLMAISSISVYDDRGELVQTIGVLDPEGFKSFKVVRTVEETQNVFFKAVVTDDEGTEKSFETEIILITLGDEVTPQPSETETVPSEVTAEPTQAVNNRDGIGNAIVIALCVVGGLIILSVAALIVMNILQKRAARKSRKIRRKIK
ncbi:MAG: hypothetical protein PUC05_08865 [Firmicutes bacterium]|nr:hypothetical protein [Bacillota bacterium]